MTPEELQRARALVDAATPGPWKADLDSFNEDDGIEACVTDDKIDLLATIGTDLPAGEWAKAKQTQALRDATFIAATRMLVPALLDEVERLQQARESVVNSIGVWIATWIDNHYVGREDDPHDLMMDLVRDIRNGTWRNCG